MFASIPGTGLTVKLKIALHFVHSGTYYGLKILTLRQLIWCGNLWYFPKRYSLFFYANMSSTVLNYELKKYSHEHVIMNIICVTAAEHLKRPFEQFCTDLFQIDKYMCHPHVPILFDNVTAKVKQQVRWHYWSHGNNDYSKTSTSLSWINNCFSKLSKFLHYRGVFIQRHCHSMNKHGSHTLYIFRVKSGHSYTFITCTLN